VRFPTHRCGAASTRTGRAVQPSPQPPKSYNLALVTAAELTASPYPLHSRRRKRPKTPCLNVSGHRRHQMPRPPASPSPPPASFPFTAGHFDYPHASTSSFSPSRSRGTGSISRALRSLSDRPERPPPAHHVAPAPRPPPSRTRQTARRGTLHRLFGPPRDSDPLDNLSRRPTTANPNRPRAQPSERYLRRSSARIREARADMESAADLLDSLSDIPINNPFIMPNSGLRARSPIVDVGSDRRQTKRRKLDHNAGHKPEFDGFKYGYKGQVVPGRLRMEILSCDGGEYFDKDHPLGLHNVRNVLKNDSSVYCSESSRCNLLLKHIGDAPFSLEKIVIRAPDRGFTAPYVALSLYYDFANPPQRSRRANICLHVRRRITIQHIRL
jgi:hypothetical protein